MGSAWMNLRRAEGVRGGFRSRPELRGLSGFFGKTFAPSHHQPPVSSPRIAAWQPYSVSAAWCSTSNVDLAWSSS